MSLGYNLRCDRCGHVESFGEESGDDELAAAGEAGWGTALDGLGVDDMPDLCPQCLAALRTWLASAPPCACGGCAHRSGGAT